MKKLKKPTPDAVYVAAFISGDEEALSKLINRHQQRLYNFIYSKVFDKENVEDVFQDTFIKVICTLKRVKYNDERKFVRWVMSNAQIVVIDHFRKRKHMRTL